MERAERDAEEPVLYQMTWEEYTGQNPFRAFDAGASLKIEKPTSENTTVGRFWPRHTHE